MATLTSVRGVRVTCESSCGALGGRRQTTAFEYSGRLAFHRREAFDHEC